MEITRREKDKIVVLDINGEIDLYNAPEIKDVIAKLIEEQKVLHRHQSREGILHRLFRNWSFNFKFVQPEKIPRWIKNHQRSRFCSKSI